ncbi:hypothetical protein GCM10010459_16140 [Microbacterium schleiferi]
MSRDTDADAKLLLHFTYERIDRIFSRFDLVSGELPAARLTDVSPPTAHEYLVTVCDDSGHDIDCWDIIHEYNPPIARDGARRTPRRTRCAARGRGV